MTIRLNKVARDLNVGIQTAVEYLQKRGFTIESSPNTKISDEQYALLVKEFSTDMNLKMESERMSQERQNKEKAKTVETEKEVKEVPKKEVVEEIKATVAEELKPRIKQVGKIDLDSLNKKTAPQNVAKKVVETKVETPKPVEQPTPTENSTAIVEPKKPEVDVAVKKPETTPAQSVKVEQKPVAAQTETQTTNIEATNNRESGVSEQQEPVKEATPISSTETPQETKSEENNGIFTLNSAKLKNSINVVGKIDLATLNQQTRPKKKTKEEKKKERESKEKQRIDTKKGATTPRPDGQGQPKP